MTEQTKSKGKGYNFDVNVKSGTIVTTPTAAGTKKIRFRGLYTSQGKQRERTFVAQGKAADLVENLIVDNATVPLRILFERAPANDNGRGGEFCTIIDLPRAKKAA